MGKRAPGQRWGPGGVTGNPGPPAAPAASLPWEALAAIDVASVPTCVVLCVPAAGSPGPPSLSRWVAMCQPQRDRCPPHQELLWVQPWPRCQLSGRWELGAGLALPWWCPLVPSADFLYPVTGKHGGGGTCPEQDLGSRRGGFMQPPAGPMAPHTVPITPPCCHLFSRPRLPSLGTAKRRQWGKSPRGWLQPGGGGGGRSRWWPLSDKFMGCMGAVTTPHLWLWAPRAVRGLTPLPGWGGWGAPQGGSTQVLARLGLPSCWVCAVGTLPVPSGPPVPVQRAITLFSSSSSLHSRRVPGRTPPPPPLPLSPRHPPLPPPAGPGPVLDVALPRCRDARRVFFSFLP